MEQKRILIIYGQSEKESTEFLIAESYKLGALKSGAFVEEIIIAELKFNPNYSTLSIDRKNLEIDLLLSWEKIKWADHIVWIFPILWGGLPSRTKGFIDRLFLPGITFLPRNDSYRWDKLLSGKSSRVISILDREVLPYNLLYQWVSSYQFKKYVLAYCGLSPVKITTLGFINKCEELIKNKRFEKIYLLGKLNK